MSAPLPVLYGFRVASFLELSLPTSQGTPDVYIKRQRVPRTGDLLWQSSQEDGFGCYQYGRRTILSWPGARFAISRQRVDVDAESELTAVDLLLNPVWSVVLAANGREALHGCAVERNGASLIVLGASGSGKTTAGISLLDRHWRLIADDLITFTADGGPELGPPFVRLCPDQASGRRGLIASGDKFRFFPERSSGSAPPRAIVVLDERFRTRLQLRGIAAINALLEQIYNPILTHAGQTRRRLSLARDLAARVPIYGAPPRSLSSNDLVAIFEEALGQ